MARQSSAYGSGSRGHSTRAWSWKNFHSTHRQETFKLNWNRLNRILNWIQFNSVWLAYADYILNSYCCPLNVVVVVVVVHDLLHAQVPSKSAIRKRGVKSLLPGVSKQISFQIFSKKRNWARVPNSYWQAVPHTRSGDRECPGSNVRPSERDGKNVAVRGSERSVVYPHVELISEIGWLTDTLRLEREASDLVRDPFTDWQPM